MRKSTRKSQPPNASASSKAGAKELERIDQVFYTYADKSSGTIDPEGIESLCSDLGVDYTDVRILMLAWKMNAARQGYFTLDEWRIGLKALKVDTISKLKKALPELEKEVSSFIEYLKTDYKVMNKDQWMGFLRFCNEISFPDFSNYDPDMAWPLILDNFVEWVREKKT